MTRVYTPRAYADPITEFLMANPRANLWAGMGVGKTVIVETLLDLLYNVVGDDDRPTLVLAPKRVAETVWTDEAKTWEHLKNLKVVSVTGDQTARAAALAQKAHVYAMGYENLAWLRQHLDDQKKPWPFGTVVPDEASRLKNFRITQGGARAQELGKIAHTYTNRWINLTGTPAANGLADLWGQQWFIDQGARLGRTFAAFQQRWFAPTTTEERVSWHLRQTSEAEIHKAVADCTMAVNPKDWFDLKDPIVNVLKVDMPPSARAKYRAMEKDFFAEIDGYEIEAMTTATKSLKLLQLASGAAYLDADRYGTEEGEPKTVEVHDVKLDALESVIEEAAGMPVLVAYHFKSDLARLQRRFPQGRTLGSGGAVIEAWNAGQVPLLFAHPMSAGHGLNLQHGGNILVFFSHWWSLEQHDQIVERIGPMRQMQAGLDRAVFIHYIVARDTIDEAVLDRRLGKTSMQQALLDYASRKGLKK